MAMSHDLAERIKESVSVSDALDLYGYQLNRHSKMLCPFHREKTPSFHVFKDDKAWKCFGCGVSGDVIDLVEKLFELEFMDACFLLCNDFNLPLPNRPITEQEKAKYADQQERRRVEKKITAQIKTSRRQSYIELVGEYRVACDAKDQAKIEELGYWLDVLATQF
jgi:DNA primase